jgi:hypothetical protein
LLETGNWGDDTKLATNGVAVEQEHQYLWVFFNDVPLTDEFKAVIQNITSS